MEEEYDPNDAEFQVPDAVMAEPLNPAADYLDHTDEEDFQDEPLNQPDFVYPDSDQQSEYQESREPTPNRGNSRRGGYMNGMNPYQQAPPQFSNRAILPEKVQKLMDAYNLMKMMKDRKKARKMKKKVKRRARMIEEMLKNQNLVVDEVDYLVNKNNKLGGFLDKQSKNKNGQINFNEAMREFESDSEEDDLRSLRSYQQRNHLPQISTKSLRKKKKKKKKGTKAGKFEEFLPFFMMMSNPQSSKAQKKQEEEKYKVIMKAMEEQSKRLHALIEENREKKEQNMVKARTDQMLDRLANLEDRILNDEDDRFIYKKKNKKAKFGDLMKVQQKYQRHMIGTMMQIQGGIKKPKAPPIYVPVPIRDPNLLPAATKKIYEEHDENEAIKKSMAQKNLMEQNLLQQKEDALQKQIQKMEEEREELLMAKDKEADENQKAKLQELEERMKQREEQLRHEMMRVQLEEANKRAEMERNLKGSAFGRASNGEFPKVIRVIKVRKKNKKRDTYGFKSTVGFSSIKSKKSKTRRSNPSFSHISNKSKSQKTLSMKNKRLASSHNTDLSDKDHPFDTQKSNSDLNQTESDHQIDNELTAANLKKHFSSIVAQIKSVLSDDVERLKESPDLYNICSSESVLEDYDLPFPDNEEVEANSKKVVEVVKRILTNFNKSLTEEDYDVSDLRFFAVYMSQSKKIFEKFHLKSELNMIKIMSDKDPDKIPTMLVYMIIFNGLIYSVVRKAITKSAEDTLRFNVRVICSVIAYFFIDWLEINVRNKDQTERSSKNDVQLDSKRFIGMERYGLLKIDALAEKDLIENDDSRIDVFHDYVDPEKLNYFSKMNEFEEIYALRDDVVDNLFTIVVQSLS